MFLRGFDGVLKGGLRGFLSRVFTLRFLRPWAGGFLRGLRGLSKGVFRSMAWQGFSGALRVFQGGVKGACYGF